MKNTAFNTRLSLLLLTLLLAACSSQPKWLDNPSAEHPKSQYLTATGQADTREAAGDRALANLAKIFEVAIKERSMDFSSSEMSSSMGTTQSSNEQRAARFISTEARQVLEGADVVEFWQEPEGQLHALAVLNKAEATQRFSKNIAKADREVSQLVDYASHKAPDPISAISAMELARTVQAERDNLNRNLSIVSNKASPGKYSADKLEDMIRNGLATLRFAAQAEDEEQLAELQNAIGNLGIQYDPQSNTLLTGVLDMEPIQQKQGWYWLRGSYELSLTIDGTVIEKKRWPVKVSATDKGLVERRAKDAINQKLPNYLYQLLSTAKVN